MSAATGPPRFPPTATLRIRKNGWSKTQRFGATSSGRASWKTSPSRRQVMEPGHQSIAKVWKSSATGPPRSTAPVNPLLPE